MSNCINCPKTVVVSLVLVARQLSLVLNFDRFQVHHIGSVRAISVLIIGMGQCQTVDPSNCNNYHPIRGHYPLALRRFTPSCS